MISAVRGSGAAPISEKTLTDADIEPRYFGQDVPLLLQGAAPSLTSYAETGELLGLQLHPAARHRPVAHQSHARRNSAERSRRPSAVLRRLSRSREQSPLGAGAARRRDEQQRNRGVRRIDQHGDAFPSPPRRARPTVQLEGGSFGSRRVSAEYQSGLLPGRFAMYARVSALRTDGYRYHSGVDGRSAISSAAGTSATATS